MRWRMGQEMETSNTSNQTPMVPSLPGRTPRDARVAWSEDTSGGAGGGYGGGGYDGGGYDAGGYGGGGAGSSDGWRKHRDEWHGEREWRQSDEKTSTPMFEDGWTTQEREVESHWETMYDNQSERYYEVHQSTGESRWWSGGGEGGGEGGGGVEEWVSTFDETSGKWYYSNAITGEICWADDVTVASVPVAASSVTASSMAASSVDVVGEWDANTESWYYVNQWTGISTWEIPSTDVDLQYRNYDLAADPVADPAANSIIMTTQVRALATVDDGRNWHEQWYNQGDAHGDHQGEELSSSVAFSSAESSAWVPVHDPESGMYYYQNGVTGVTQWNSPWEEEKSESERTEISTAAAGMGEVVLEEADVWEAVWDDVSHAWYYYNALTGETQW